MTTKEPLAALDAALNKSHHGEQVARKLEAFDDLVAACEDLADFVEGQFRHAFLSESKAAINKMVIEHTLLAPARAALKKAKG